MVFRDRTDELKHIAEGFHTVPDSKPKPPPRKEAQDFLSFAANVNRDLTSVSESLSKLTQLVRQRNVFEDHSSEINDLTGVVQQQLGKVKSQMQLLDQLKQNAVRSRGRTQEDKHTEAVVTTLQTTFKDTATGFQELLQERSASLQGTKERRSKFTSNVDESIFHAHDDAEGMGQLALHMPQSNLTYYNARVNDVKQVEKSIHELGDLFKEFARLVTEQEELVLRIDDDTTEALDNVNRGGAELQRYLRSISSNKWLLIKVFGVLFVFIIFFGTFILR
jgi:syntaxin 5